MKCIDKNLEAKVGGNLEAYLKALSAMSFL
jgi:hypothetical protein